MLFGVAQLRRVVLSAGLLAIGVLGTALPAAANVDDLGPDLAVTMSSSPVGQVQSGGNLAYTLTVTNTASTWRECFDTYPGKPPRCVTYKAGGPVSNVVVQNVLPAGVVYQSASATSGFNCAAAGGTVTCAGGALPATGTAQIVFNTLAPTLQPGGANQVLTNSATVNPAQTINERTYDNNVASVLVTDIAPQAKADLVVTGFTGPASVQAGGQATYTINIANVGQLASSNNVSVLLDGGNGGFTIASSSSSGGFSPCYSSPERFSLRAWCPGFGYGSLAAGASATITAVVQLPATGGNYTMSATIDPFNSVAEWNESNNQRTLGLSVY